MHRPQARRGISFAQACQPSDVSTKLRDDKTSIRVQFSLRRDGLDLVDRGVCALVVQVENLTWRRKIARGASVIKGRLTPAGDSC